MTAAGCALANPGATNTNPVNSQQPSEHGLNGAQCMAIPESTAHFGDIRHEDIESWLGLENWLYTTNPDHLEIGHEEISGTFLRQKLAPIWKGSVRVLGSGTLAPSPIYTLTQSFFLEPGFDWGGRNEGGKLGFGLGGGSTPTGGKLLQDGFSARLMWRGNRDGTARMTVYSYAADRYQNLPYGDDYPIQDFLIPVGEWFTVTMELTVNTHTGSSDGAIAVWVNDELKLQKENIHWQAAGESPTIDRLLYATFHGGNDSSWSPGTDVYARFDDICWQPQEYTPVTTTEPPEEN